MCGWLRAGEAAAEVGPLVFIYLFVYFEHLNSGMLPVALGVGVYKGAMLQGEGSRPPRTAQITSLSGAHHEQV